MINYRDYEKECDNMKVSECEELITLYRGLQEKFDNDVFMVMTSIYKIGFEMGKRAEEKENINSRKMKATRTLEEVLIDFIKEVLNDK